MNDKTNKVEAVITDVGGVLNHTEFGSFADKLKEYCSAKADRIYEAEHRLRINELDAGSISAEAYISRLQDEVGLRLDLKQYRSLLHNYVHWHSDLIDHFEELGKTTYILSNNSTLFITDERRSMLGAVFDKQFYSHEIGSRKPDDEIYEHVVSEISEAPRRSVFIDDKQANLDVAQEFGLQTHLFTGQDDLLGYLNRIAR